MKKVMLAACAAVALVPAQASAHYYGHCRKNACKRHVIKPYRATFHSIAACESHHNPRALSPGGKYRGLYQFDFGSWRGAGGYGDPINFGYLEQTYRAVVWLHRNGRDSWPNC